MLGSLVRLATGRAPSSAGRASVAESLFSCQPAAFGADISTCSSKEPSLMSPASTDHPALPPWNCTCQSGLRAWSSPSPTPRSGSQVREGVSVTSPGITRGPLASRTPGRMVRAGLLEQAGPGRAGCRCPGGQLPSSEVASESPQVPSLPGPLHIRSPPRSDPSGQPPAFPCHGPSQHCWGRPSV